MQYLIMGVITVLLCITFTLLILKNKELVKITEKLKYINERTNNEVVNISYPDKEIEMLCKEINKTLELKRSCDEKYKKLDLEIRQSIANISHDLRTPLTSIMGYIQLIERNDLSYEEKQKYLEVVKNRGKVLIELVNSFYDLSRLQANEYEFNIEKIDIRELFIETITGFYDDFIMKNLEPNIEVEDDIPFVCGDIIAIERVYNNLIQNMLKHGCGNIKITMKRKGEFIVNSFSNEAKGLNQHDVNRIFERFFTGDRMRSGQNTGLGLAITKTLVESMGHKIYAEKEGKNLVIIVMWRI